MKVCWTIFRDHAKIHGKMLREDLISDLIEMGVPKEMAHELIHSDKLEWTGVINGTDTFVALNIIDQSNANLEFQ